MITNHGFDHVFHSAVFSKISQLKAEQNGGKLG